MTVQTKKMHGKPVQSKKVTVHVLNWDIEGAECRKPTKCMIKVAVKRALNLAHGYIHVDATGVSIVVPNSGISSCCFLHISTKNGKFLIPIICITDYSE